MSAATVGAVVVVDLIREYPGVVTVGGTWGPCVHRNRCLRVKVACSFRCKLSDYGGGGGDGGGGGRHSSSGEGFVLSYGRNVDCGAGGYGGWIFRLDRYRADSESVR